MQLAKPWNTPCTRLHIFLQKPLDPRNFQIRYRAADPAATAIAAIHQRLRLNFSDIGVILWKEIRTALMCGIALAVVCFGKIWLVDHMLLGNENITLMVDLVVCLALCVTVVVAKIVGCLLPMAAKAVKLDPAVMASPFISTIVDALSLLVYFMFAKLLLKI